MTVSPWRRGQHVVWRSLPRPDQVGYVLPALVVADDDDAAAVFQPHGTVCKYRTGSHGGPSGRVLLEWDGGHGDRVWSGPSTLRLHVVGTGFSVIRCWEPDSACYRGWYVNLEAPWRRTVIGFDSRDHVLDITVADDLSSWAWKDRDDYGWSRLHSTIDDRLAGEIEQAADQAILALEARAWPFSADWSAWQPDPAWTTPTMIRGWDTVSPR